VANQALGNAGTVTPIDTATNTAGTPIALGTNPSFMAISPNGATLYVTTYANTVIPIDTATNTAGTPLDVAGTYGGVAVTPDGSTVFVVGSNTVTPIDAATDTVGAPIAVGNGSQGIAIAPDDATAYVPNSLENTVTPIDTATDTAGTPITVGAEPTAIAITPDQAPVAGLTATPGAAGTPTSFDASTSTVAYGTITDYAWNFGDGQTADTSSATVDHTYAVRGSYTASVTETDSAGTSTTRVFTGQTVSDNGGPSAKTTTMVPVPGGATAYIANLIDGTVTPVNTATDTAGTPIPVGTNPYGVAITPDGTTAYVTNSGDNTVTPITTATNTPGTPIPVGNGPIGIAITPNGKTAYVTNSISNTVTPITTATDTPGTPIAAGSYPSAIAIAPNGATAYVSDGSANTVTPINLVTNTPGTPIPVGNEPGAITITPDGSTAYVADGGASAVTPINLATNTAEAPIAVGPTPIGLAASPLGGLVYEDSLGDNTLTPIDTATNTAGTPISLDNEGGIAFTPDGSTAFALYGSGVTLIDTATNTPGTSIPTGNNPLAIAITPDQGPTASLSASADGSTASFDASASGAGAAPIVSYAWHFGDGSTATTSTPTTTHTYAASGSYTATVTETDQAGTSTTQVFTGQTLSRNGSSRATASATVVIDVVDCAGASSCQAQVAAPATPSSPAQTVTVSTPAPGQASQQLVVSIGPGLLSCSTAANNFAAVGSVVSYGSTFVPSGNVKIKDLIAGATSVAGITICFVGPSHTEYLPTCSPGTVPCVTLAVVSGGVKATIKVAPGDPKFRVQTATATESATKVSASGVVGGTVTIKGTGLLGPTGKGPQVLFSAQGGQTTPPVAVGTSSTNTKLKVTVPRGAATGPVTLIWPDGQTTVTQGSIVIT
jgi:YVTN family beta-propeller protein